MLYLVLSGDIYRSRNEFHCNTNVFVLNLYY